MPYRLVRALLSLPSVALGPHPILVIRTADEPTDRVAQAGERGSRGRFGRRIRLGGIDIGLDLEHETGRRPSQPVLLVCIPSDLRQLFVVRPDRLPEIGDRAPRTLLAGVDVVEVEATGLAVRENGFALFHQPLGLASPAPVIGQLGDCHLGGDRRLAESVTPLPVPAGGGEEVLDPPPRRAVAFVVLQRPDNGRAPFGRDVRVLRERPYAWDQLGIAASVERECARLSCAFDERVPLAGHGVVGRLPDRVRGFRRRRRGDTLNRCLATIGGRRCSNVRRRRPDFHRSLAASALQGQLTLPHLRTEILPLRLLLCPVHVAHRRRAAVAARPVVQRLEGVEFSAPDAGALGQQRSKGLRAGAEGFRLPEQRRMAVEGLAIGIAQGHRIAIGAGPRAQLVPGRQHFPPAGGEGVHRRAVAPGEGGAPYVPRDPCQRVVVRSREGLVRYIMLHAAGGAATVPYIFAAVFPVADTHVIERRFLGNGPRPALGQMRSDLTVQHRRVPVAVRAPVGHVERQRGAVDINVDLLAVAGRGRIDRLPRRPVVGQQEGLVHSHPLGRSYGHRIAVIEADVAVPVPDLVVTERHLAPVVGARRDQNRGLVPRFARSRPGLTPQDFQFLHGDHGAVEELLLPAGGADANAVADGDLQWRCRPVVLRSPANMDRHGFGAASPAALRRANRRSRIR